MLQKQVYQLGNHYITGKPIAPQFTKPKTVAQGMLMGGLLQDLINEAPKNWVKEHHLQDWKFKSEKKKKKH